MRLWVERHKLNMSRTENGEENLPVDRSSGRQSSGSRDSAMATVTTTFVVTSESRQVLRDLNDYMTSNYTEKTSGESSKTIFPMRFLINTFDVAQDTGYLHEMNSSYNVSSDDAMLSALSSLKLQLTTTVATGNCCSNFHLLFKDFHNSGCGVGSGANAFFVCLQDHPDEDLRPCCKWDTSKKCDFRSS